MLRLFSSNLSGYFPENIKAFVYILRMGFMSLYKTAIMKNEKSFVELRRAQPLDPSNICINTSSNAVFILYIITHIKLELLK